MSRNRKSNTVLLAILKIVAILKHFHVHTKLKTTEIDCNTELIGTNLVYHTWYSGL